MAPSPRVALVTGCSDGGIGHALCEELLAQHWRVFATARRLDSMAGLAERGATLLTLDVNDGASVAAAVAAVQRDCGHVDLLVNNAGHGCFGPLAEVPLDKVRAVFETNVMGLLSVCQAVAPGMAARQSGTILNVASIAGLVATPFGGAYCATKAAVIALSDALRVELAPLGVRVSCVCPGAIRSKFADNCRVGADELGGLRLYAPWRDAIVRRQGASQRGAAPTPAGEFALRVVAAMGGGGGGSTPPPLFCVGTYSTLFRAVAWLLPRWARDALLARLFMSRV